MFVNRPLLRNLGQVTVLQNIYHALNAILELCQERKREIWIWRCCECHFFSAISAVYRVHEWLTVCQESSVEPNKMAAIKCLSSLHLTIVRCFVKGLYSLKEGKRELFPFRALRNYVWFRYQLQKCVFLWYLNDTEGKLDFMLCVGSFYKEESTLVVLWKVTQLATPLVVLFSRCWILFLTSFSCAALNVWMNEWMNQSISVPCRCS